MACTSAQVSTSVIDSGEWALGRIDSVQWIDDDRLLFLGNEGKGKPKAYLREWVLKLFQALQAFEWVDLRLSG
jgi:hypothetical protein